MKSVGFKIYLKLIRFSLSPWSASTITHRDQPSSLLAGPTAPAVVPHSLFFPKQPEGACEHLGQVPLLCPQRSRAPTFLRVKAKSSGGPQGLYNLPHPFSLSPLLALSSRLSLFTIPPICHTRLLRQDLCTGYSLCQKCYSPIFFSFFLSFFFFAASCGLQD